MCGIGGQVNFSRNGVAESTMRSMCSLLEHRGKDDSGIVIRGNVGLVHQRLAIIGLDNNGKQPMTDEAEQVYIVFNGEIFNYIELREKLAAEGGSFRTKTDTEVILKGYLRYGIEIVNQLEGMFAFAIVDFRLQKIYLVRDRLGIKPLYYTTAGNCLSFASEIKALVKSGCLQAKIDLCGLKEYIHMQLYVGRRTLFDGVYSLEPGTYRECGLQDGQTQHKKYWDFPDCEVKAPYGEIVETLRNKMLQGIKLWSRADVPVAAYISGGLDSSFVASAAQSLMDTDRLSTFSSIYPEMQFEDEREYSDEVAEMIHSDHHRVILDQEEIIADHKNLIYALDMPMAGYSAPYRTLSRIVRKTNKVVLTGHGGDEFLCGYPKYISAYLVDALNRGYRGESSQVRAGFLQYIKRFEKQAGQIIGNSLFLDENSLFRSLFYRTDYLWEYMNPEIRRLTADYDVAGQALDILSDYSVSGIKKFMRLDQRLLLPALLNIEDRTSMSVNLESRTPLLGTDIVEYESMIPEKYLLQDGLKGIMRRVAAPYLPQKVHQNTQKSGTMYPVQELFFGRMYPEVKKMLMKLDETGLFDIPMDKLLLQLKERQDNRATWALWSLACWGDSFL